MCRENSAIAWPGQRPVRPSARPGVLSNAPEVLPVCCLAGWLVQIIAPGRYHLEARPWAARLTSTQRALCLKELFKPTSSTDFKNSWRVSLEVDKIIKSFCESQLPHDTAESFQPREDAGRCSFTTDQPSTPINASTLIQSTRSDSDIQQRYVLVHDPSFSCFRVAIASCRC